MTMKLPEGRRLELTDTTLDEGGQPHGADAGARLRDALQGAAAAALLLLIFVLQVQAAQLDVPRLLEHVVNDDTFYYLEVAQRAARGQGFTFDGIHATNGFQPAWGFLLTAIATWIPDKVAFLRASVLLAALFNLAAGMLVFRISMLVLARPLWLVPLLIWSSIQFTSTLPLTALETSLNWAVFALTILYLVGMARRRGRTPGPVNRGRMVGDTAAVGLLCALLFLCRVDNILFVAIAIALAAWLHQPPGTLRWRIPQFLAGAAVTGVVALVAVVPYLAWNELAHGGLLPVSGAIKQQQHYVHVVAPAGGYFSPTALAGALETLAFEARWILAFGMSSAAGGEHFWLPDPAPFAAISLLLLAAAWGAVRLAGAGREADRRTTAAKVLFVWVAVSTLFWLLYCSANLIPAGTLRQAAKVALLPGALAATVWLARRTVHTLGYEAAAPPRTRRAGYAGELAPTAAPTATPAATPAATLAATLAAATGTGLTTCQQVILWFLPPIAAHLTILVFTVGYYLDYAKWYYGNYFVILALSVGVLAQYLYTNMGIVAPAVRRALYPLFLGWLLLGFGVSAFAAVATMRAPLVDPTARLNGQYQMAQWIDANLPEDSVIGAYNAGVLGYFSGRPTINLDGLINNRSIVPYLYGPKTMTDYVDETCPDYIVDYTHTEIDPDQFGAAGTETEFLLINAEQLKLVHTFPSMGPRPRTFYVLELDKRFCRPQAAAP